MSILYDEFKFSKDAILVIESYLIRRSQYVEYNNSTSDCKPVPCGVPQGSLMGPLLFSLYVNDLPNCLDASIDKGLYADDFQFIVHGSKDNLPDLVLRANAELRKISDWFARRKLKLNAGKSSAMFVSSSEVFIPDDLCDITLNDNVINIEDCVKNLGLFMDQTLGFERHINEMMKRIYHSLHSLRINKCYIEESMRLRLVQALVIPHFLYCDSIISCVNSRLRYKIEKAFKCVLRFVYGLRKRESTKNYSKNIFGCNIFDYFDFRFSLFIFKLIQFKEPECLYERLSFSRSERTCNLNIPKFSNIQRNKFSVRSAQLWNSLPNEIKRETNFCKFRKMSFEHFSTKN